MKDKLVRYPVEGRIGLNILTVLIGLRPTFGGLSVVGHLLEDGFVAEAAIRVGVDAREVSDSVGPFVGFGACPLTSSCAAFCTI